MHDSVYHFGRRLYVRQNNGCVFIVKLGVFCYMLIDKDLDLLSMFLIVFTVDIVLFTTDPGSLQSQIDTIYPYCEQWSLKINISKTKLCLFEKRKLSNYIFVNND